MMFLWITLFTAILIFLNYFYAIDHWINQHEFAGRFGYRYLLSLISFATPYLLLKLIPRSVNCLFLLLILLSPAIFSLKMAIPLHIGVTADPNWNHYWNRIISWPARSIITMTCLFLIWRKYYSSHPFFGFNSSGIKLKPYGWMLLIMVPLIALASTRLDFLLVYPKMSIISSDVSSSAYSWIYKMLFELSYGSDFLTIEGFFRGFLIVGFIRWAGQNAILPMACFYCSIHFGKPLGECISSYPGGILLGIIVYNTRSIWGGLFVHLGIAWLMEAAGILAGNH